MEKITKEQIGCCGAFCGACPVKKGNRCKGCKTGYESGKRNLAKAKCRMKVCCLQNKLCSCADCQAFETCEILRAFYLKNGYKYKKYRESLGFIRSNGYQEFLDIAKKWTKQYGTF